jgi:hypothetical protein
VGGYNGILSTGTFKSGDVLAPGGGVRFMWYPRNCAFRVGQAESNYWDDDGSVSTKLANYSIAMGYMPRATGPYSVAIGTNNYASGQHALALGAYVQALADYSIAIGYDAWATGMHSVCIGTGLSTNGTEGSVLIGDHTPFARVYSSNNNQITMRFTGGYRFWTHAIDSICGVYMRGGTSGWTNYCNRNIKENFEKINLEELLTRIKNIPVTKWNYKSGDPTIKYIGPVAQDFYAAFQLGGTDSLGINSINIDGVNMAGVQALINRTDELKSNQVKLSEDMEILKEAFKKIEELQKLIIYQNAKIEQQQKVIDQFKEKLSIAKNESAIYR